MALSSRSVTIFATIEALRDKQADIRYPLATLFEPDLATFNGEVFDPSKLSAKINSEYHLGITVDVLEDFIPIFEARGWLKRIHNSGEKVALLIQCPPASQVPAELSRFEATASEIAIAFRDFIKELSPLSQVHRSDSELVDDLIEWLMLLDRMGENSLQNAPTTYKVGTKIVFNVDDSFDGGSPSEGTFLSARFVEHLFAIESKYIPFLIELCEVGLISEVVRDFQNPTTSKTKTSLSLYLDAPLALDYLGLSGKPQQESVGGLLSSIKESGGNLRIFRVSVEEMQNSLNALLNRAIPERTGPTADALRRREVHEAFVRQVAVQPDKFLAAAGIGILDERLDMYPNSHKFWTTDAYQQLYSQIGWVKEDLARHHDALISTLAFRKRNGHRSSDLFDSKHIVLTRNPTFPSTARRIALEQSYIGPPHVGPVVHVRQLATAIWLRMGNQSSSEIPRSYILSSCRRVLTLRKNIVEKVSHFKSSLSDDQAQQLEILMSSDRSAQVLMDKTLGSAAVIDSTNIGVLLEEMKRAQIAEYSAERDAEIASLSKEAKSRERRLSDEAAAARKLAEMNVAESSRLRDKLNEIARSAVAEANRIIKRRRKIGISSVAVLVVLLTASGLFWNFQYEVFSVAIAFFLILGALILQLAFGLREIFVDPFLQRMDEQILEQCALKFGLDFDDLYRKVTHEGHRFSLVEE